MPEAEEIEATVRQLRAALKSEALNGNVAELARQCLGRLTGTVRLSVLGPALPQGAEVLNFVVGQRVATPQSGACLLQLRHSTVPMAKAFFADGKSEAFSADQLSQVYGRSPSMVEFGLDLKALKKISVVRGMAPGGSDLRRTTRWAALESDVALWVTTSFTEEEEQIWSALPERLQHHGYLLIPRGSERAADIRERAASLFADVIEFDGRAASKARSAPGGVDKEKFREAGGPTLVRAVKREIDVIGKSALDAAQVILLRHLETPVEPPRPRAPEPEAPMVAPQSRATSMPPRSRPVTEPMRPRLVSSTEAPRPTEPQRERPTATPWAMNLPEETPALTQRRRTRPVSMSRARSVQVSETTQQEAAEMAQKLAAAAEAKAAAEARAAADRVVTRKPGPAAPIEVIAVFGKIQRCFEDRARALQTQIEAGETIDHAAAVQAMADDVERAVELLSDPNLGDRPEVARLRECVEETGELLLLMSLEDDPKSVEDGVCLLLQIRREAHGYLAA